MFIYYQHIEKLYPRDGRSRDHKVLENFNSQKYPIYQKSPPQKYYSPELDHKVFVRYY